jgi:Asp-tRNA(Asn)/Glu-tRNA(Gln) amidotransferase A subunit family amidase
MVEALAVHRAAGWYPAHASEYTEETLASLRVAETLADDVDEAARQVRALSAALRDAIRDVDILVLPTTPTVAPSLAEAARVEPGTLRRPVVRQLTRLVGPVGWADLAAVSVPCGLIDGLPVGLQLVGRDEGTVLTAAVGYQERTGFHRVRA